ncbi:MAG: sialidase family protein [Blastopirellula sp. JB062]
MKLNSLWVTPLVTLASVASAFAQIPSKAAAPHAEQILLDSKSFVANDENAYLAFPTLIKTDDGDVLISYKRGRTHAQDSGAPLEMIRFDPIGNQIVSRQFLGSDPQLIFQMGEWIRFPSGRIGNFVDMQKMVPDRGKKQHHRIGVYYAVSDDEGKTFTTMRPLDAVDGVDYGYVFDAVESDGKTYVLAMTFPELTERRSKFDEQGKRIYGTVAALAYDEKNDAWSHVRDLNQAFGDIRINESCLIQSGDRFLVGTRGYDNQFRLHLVDKKFQPIKSNNLTAQYEEIGSHIGRPRFFRKEGQLYLLGRNAYRGKMELALFRLNEAALSVEQRVRLDPEGDAKIVDGYYAMHYFQPRGDRDALNVITYRRKDNTRHPDLIRLEFDWNDVR